MAVAFEKAASREDLSFRSALTTSAPRSLRDVAVAPAGLRVMARTVKVEFRFLRKWWTIPLPFDMGQERVDEVVGMNGVPARLLRLLQR